MPRHSPETFLAAVQANRCLLALDVSARRIGMAVTDPGRGVALPAGTLVRGKWAEDAAALIKMVQDKQIGGLVIGLPFNMNGTMGPAAQSRLTFGRNLEQLFYNQAIEMPYVFVDESLTSHEARDVLAGRGGRDDAEDQMAACQLLASFINYS